MALRAPVVGVRDERAYGIVVQTYDPCPCWWCRMLRFFGYETP